MLRLVHAGLREPRISAQLVWLCPYQRNASFTDLVGPTSYVLFGMP